YFLLQGRLRGPVAQERDDLRVGELEENVLRVPQLGLRTGQDRVRVLQFGRRVGGAAVLARVAILVPGAASRTFALDVAVRQEHAFDRIEELLDRLLMDEARLLEARVHVSRQSSVFFAVRRVPVVVAQMKALVVLAVRLRDAADERLRRDALGFRSQ